MSNGSRFRSVVDLVATLVVITVGTVVIWGWIGPGANPVAKSKPAVGLQAPAAPVSIAGAITRGSQAAAVGLIEFTDFQCQFCARFSQQTLPTILQKYVDPGRVRYAFRNYPLAKTHPAAIAAAKIATCAADVGKFWEVHEAFFESPAGRSEDEFRLRGKASGLSEQAIRQCLSDDGIEDRVRADITLGSGLQFRATPVFLVGVLDGDMVTVGSVIVGAKPLAEFERAIDTELRRHSTR